MDSYQTFIAASRYARWDDQAERRETWEETVNRCCNFLVRRMDDLGVTGYGKDMQGIKDAIVAQEVMPSMRCLMTAGEALSRDNVAGFNCSYLPIDHPKAFDELMYILMCGTGVGFSVERQYIQKLPEISEEFYDSETSIVVPDSKIGWAKSFRQLISLLYSGEVPQWDDHLVRPSGALLKTFGGRASGPEPLRSLYNYTVDLFRDARGRRLSSLEAHDLCCKIAEVIVVGGVRRSALISLSNPSDGRLRTAKMGRWFDQDGHRAMANNSACYTEKPEFDFFLSEMQSLYESRSGERGIFSRVAAKNIAGRNGRRDIDHEFGTNPCSEIILRPNQFCNLTEVVVREDDDLDSLLKKVERATILGTIQASLTDFRYLRSIWKRNTEEEALLGVSLTGIMDHKVMSGQQEYWDVAQEGGVINLEQTLEALREKAIATNKKWAKRLGINPAAAITCIKPSGTVSQLVDSASGIHPRFAPYYIRRVRADKKDPLAMYMEASGFPCEDDLMQPSNLVFSFPVKSPAASYINGDVGALKQLETWKTYQDHWCEHKPSITVYYTDDEFLDVCAWMWKNFDYLSGISLLPLAKHSYHQLPYEEIDEETYYKMEADQPVFDWETLATFESEDRTAGSQELACVGTSCEFTGV